MFRFDQGLAYLREVSSVFIKIITGALLVGCAGFAQDAPIKTIVITQDAKPATQASPDVLPSPLRVEDVLRLASGRRAEVTAAAARTRAAAQRPAIVSALADPMLAPSIDHLPYMFNGVNRSITIEQSFPLPGVRGNRRRVAEAQLERTKADSDRTILDVELEAANAFYMLYERRRTAAIVEEQSALARQVVAAADARYAGGTGPQSDVLQAEVSVARLAAIAATLKGEIHAAEAMLNASLALDTSTRVPPLAVEVERKIIPDWPSIAALIGQRPELAGGRADINRASAEVQVMRDMFKPMLTVRAGTAYTMTDGRGAMLMVGVSLPIWRSKLKAGVAEAEAMRDMTKADLDAMSRMVEGQAAASRNQVIAAKDRYNALRKDVLPRARYAIDTALSSYAAGRVPLVSVLEAVQGLWAAQMDVIEAEAGLGLAWSRLGRAIGTNKVVFP